MKAPAPALVLTAGLGTRLFPLTLTRAKPAAPVAGVPLVTRILQWLAAHQVRDAVLNLHHRPESIARVVGDGSDLGIRVRYSWEQPVVLGSAGGPRRALPLLESDRAFIVNGDTLTGVDLAGLVEAHQRAGAMVTLTVVPNRKPDRYGGVLVADDGLVTGFTRRGDTRPSWHFVGVQLVETQVFAALEDGVPVDSIGGAYRTLMTEPGALAAWRTDGVFVDIGTPADYLRATTDLAHDERRAGAWLGARCSVAPSAHLEDSVLWDDVVVGAGATLTRCVVADGADIPAGARFHECAIAPASALETAPPTPVRIDHGLVIAPLDPYR